MAERIEESVFNRLGFMINRASWAVRRRISRVLESSGMNLTPEQWVAINVLYEREGICQTQLADLMSREKASITRMLENLVDQGLATKRPDPKDRRKHLIFLSPEGRAFREEYFPKIFAEYRRLIQGIEDEDHQVAYAVLARICRNAE